MKKLLFTVILLSFLCTVMQAQEAKDTVAIGEVVVKASRVVRRVDGQTVYPSELQKKHSFNGYSLLKKLMLPGIRVDEMSRTVQSLTNRGDVQLRINGIVANAHDMQAIDVANITSVDFIDNPGVRYGAGIGYVVNIHTRRSEKGYAIGAQAMNTLTATSGFNNVYASANNEKSQWRLFCEQEYRDLRGSRTNETARYQLADGTQHDVSRNMLDTRTRSFDHPIE